MKLKNTKSVNVSKGKTVTTMTETEVVVGNAICGQRVTSIELFRQDLEQLMQRSPQEVYDYFYNNLFTRFSPTDKPKE